ncbi:Uncharacterised protein [Amycolatopsis camponoti]|uniref:HTH cro/C1-type domain-containing protein n=1 Tax=Amycolatopsis camponoti TaxID=2606593 RepID=A0A6I8M4S2_9PSEU|nr:helix-turn-helix transcriptional regulator [Amycolatopsis camponoti]VVJ22650.1 Uncharacterised protein [Amycolatopsis camponoti]
MPGDTALGAVLRQLRVTRNLTQGFVARRAGCDQSLLSKIESGLRALPRWLAIALDEVYLTGSMVTDLLHNGDVTSHLTGGRVSPDGLVLVQLPGGGPPMAVSRRQLLATVGVGLLGSSAAIALEQTVSALTPTQGLLADYTAAFEGYQIAVRTMAPTRLIDAMAGRAVVLDLLRRRTSGALRRAFLALQGRYAESLSWLNEEAGRTEDALFWLDRAGEWAQIGGWNGLAGYTYVRRSMLVLTAADDSGRAIELAETALAMPGVPARIRGLAAKQAAFGHAIAHNADASARALDTAMELLAAGHDESAGELGQRSVPGDDLYAIFQATCAVHLGRGEQAIDVLQPRLSRLSAASPRTAAITTGKLAHAYANVGLPTQAAQLAMNALEQAKAIESQSTSREIRRALVPLQQWHRRDDVAELLHRMPLGAVKLV